MTRPYSAVRSTTIAQKSASLIRTKIVFHHFNISRPANNDMKKILVPIDGSPNSFRGLSKALDLAKKDNATVYALHIIVLSPSIAIGGSRRSPKNEIEKKIDKTVISPARKKCEQEGIPFEYKITYGADPGYDIVKFANKHRFEMIVMGARGLNSLKKIFLGSASDYVLKKAKVPVLIVK